MREERKSESWIIQLDDSPDGFSILDESIIGQMSIKNQNDSKQIDDTEEWADFKQPEIPLQTLANMVKFNTWHKRCCDVVSLDSTSRNWTIIPRPDLDHEPQETQKQQAKNFIRGLSTKIQDILRETTYDRRSMACAALEIIREGKSDTPPVDLVPMTVQDLHLHKDGIRVKQVHGTQEVWFVIYGQNKNRKGEGLFDIHYKTGKQHPYNSLPPEERANEVMWFREYSSKNKTYGLANVVPAMNAIVGDQHRAKFNTEYLKNLGMTGLIITVSGDYKDYTEKPFLEDGTKNPKYDKRKTLQYRTSKQVADLIKHPGSAMVITVPGVDENSKVDVDVTTMTNDLKEASFRMYRTDNREEVCVANGVPPERIGIAKDTKYSNLSGLGDVYSDSTIPWIRGENEDIINDLFYYEMDITDWMFSLGEFRKKDETIELNNGTLLFEHGALTLKEYSLQFAKKYGAEIPDIPIMNYRLICGQLVDENGIPINSTGVDETAFLEDLEGQLIDEADNIEEEDNVDKGVIDDNKTTTKQEDKTDIDGTKKLSNKNATNSITEAITRAFNLRT